MKCGEKMGIMAGICFFLVGFYYCYMQRWGKQLFKKSKVNKYYSKPQIQAAFYLVFFFGWGILLWVLAYLNCKDILISIVMLNGCGIVFLMQGIYHIYQLCSCHMEVQGVFLCFWSVIGVPPVFEYQVNGISFKGPSLSCGIRQEYREKMIQGQPYVIYVNPKHPCDFVAAKKIEPVHLLFVGTGVAFLSLLILYLL